MHSVDCIQELPVVLSMLSCNPGTTGYFDSFEVCVRTWLQCRSVCACYMTVYLRLLELNTCCAGLCLLDADFGRDRCNQGEPVRGSRKRMFEQKQIACVKKT